MHSKKYRSFCVGLILLGLSSMSFAQAVNSSYITVMNTGQQTIYATYEAIDGHEEKIVTLDAQQSIALPLNAHETGIHILAMNGQKIPVNPDSEHACTTMIGGNPIKLQFNAERMSCQSNEP